MLTFAQQNGMHRYAEAREIVLDITRGAIDVPTPDHYLRLYAARVIGYHA